MMKKKSFFLTIFSSLLCISHCTYGAEQQPQSEKLQPEASMVPKDEKAAYTINFDNVPLVQYIKFVSKIGKLNFIYNEEDLKFNVTILSEEETSLVNIMSALVQVLRINGYDLIEQGNNYVIAKLGATKQIANVVSQESPLEKDHIPPIMTRVFQIKNANPSIVAGIITPLLSSNAIIEVSMESRHLIVTDITQNIEQIQKLLLSLDSPKSALEMDSYISKNNIPSQLIPLLTQIITPISEGNPIIFVPQDGTNTTFIVSTPFLIEKALSILEDLDTPPSFSAKLAGPISGQNILIYHILHKPANALQAAIRQVKDNLVKMGATNQPLVQIINTMKFIRESHALLFFGEPKGLSELQNILKDLDAPYTPEELAVGIDGFYMYKIREGTEEQIANSLKQLVDSLKKANYPDTDLIQSIESMKWMKENNSLLFSGDKRTISKLEQILPKFDVPKSAATPEFYVYSPKNQPGELLLSQINDVYKNLSASGLSDPSFLLTLSSVKWTPSSHSLVFTGNTASIERIRALLAIIDQVTPYEAQVYVYQIKHVDHNHIEEGLRKISKSLPQGDLLASTIDKMKYISESNSLIFKGPISVIDRLKEIVPTLDTIESARSEFYVYKPKFVTSLTLQDEIKEASKELKNSGLEDTSLITALSSAHLVSNGEAIMFTGTPDAINKVKVMVAGFDKNKEENQTNQLFIYKPKNQEPAEIVKQAIQTAKEMKSGGFENQYLINALQSASVVSNGKAVLFTGTPSSIEKIKEIATTLDLEKSKSESTEVYVYKPINAQAVHLQDQLKEAAKEMKTAGLSDPSLIEALQNSRLISDGQSLLFTGSPETIEKIKIMVSNFDLRKEAAEKATEFFVYKPEYLPADKLQATLKSIAIDMKKIGFEDPNFLNSLSTTRLVSEGKAIFFTGSKESIVKVKELLPSVDVIKEEALKIGKTTFIIYKIKYVPGPILMTHLHNLANDLQRTGTTDEDLVKTINSMRYVKDTNSIIFTGSPITLEKVRSLAEKFDIAELSGGTPARAPPGYLLYKPKNQSGEDLISTLRDFEQNLVASGVNEPAFFDVINNLKWMKKTSTILLSGPDDATKKVYGLLERFDLPGSGISSVEPGIETVSDTSFLIYKLQYHSGGEILDALKKIGIDLGYIKKQSNENLMEAIKALQWIEVTNSLISTGDAIALAKLKELVKSIDVPLKQVFVEVLVIQTSTANTLNFGLRWGSQGNYKDKFAYSTGLFPQVPSSGTDPFLSFNQELQTVTGTVFPNATQIPFTTGWDLGVIGDVILHKGKSYFALGSLVNALQVDGESTIVLNQKLITQDNKNSTIFVGTNIPYTGSLVTNQSQSTVTSANLEYRDVGVNLSITPNIGNDDIITLDIEEDISSVLNNSASGAVSTTTVQGITTSKATTKTTVSLPDKHFVVLSGQIADTTDHNRTSIPCLGGLPLIGAAFAQNDFFETQVNLIIFIRPHIIKSFDIYREITDRQEDIYRSQTVPEDFDAGLELVKTPDDE